MAIDKTTYAAAKKYTDTTVAGGGAIKGKNCTIDSITPITGGNKVTFKWTLDNGTVQTSDMNVMNGDKGDDGLGIKSVDINANNHLIVTFDDNTTKDAGLIPGVSPQVSTLPTASATEVGKVYQYIGLSTGSLTHGYFYECKLDSTSGDYIWESVSVQAGGGSGVDYFKDLDDVSFGTLTDGDLPEYDAAADKWKNSQRIPLSISALQGSMANVKSDIDLLSGSQLALRVAIEQLDLLMASKVDKVAGKGLSTNDYTNEDKQKLSDMPPIKLIGSGLTLDADGKLSATGMDIPIDDALDESSPRPVQNQAIAVPVHALQASMTTVKLDVDQLKASDLSIKHDVHEIELDLDQLAASTLALKLTVEQMAGSLGTAAKKDSTNEVLANSTDLVESGAVRTAINSAISSVYKPAGDKTVAQLVSALLVKENLGNVYNMTTAGVTTADFVGGAGKVIAVGDNVGIVDVGTLLSPDYKFDLFVGEHSTDEWSAVEQCDANGKVIFDNLSDDYGYLLTAQNVLPKILNCRKDPGTNTGTIKLTYTTDCPLNTNCKLRIFK